MPPPTDLEHSVRALLNRIEIDDSVEVAIRAWGAKATDVLRRIVRGDLAAGSYERANAAYLLGLIQPPKATGDLTHAAAGDNSQEVRLSALDAIGRMGGIAARKFLVKTTGSAAASVAERLHAVSWLARIGEHDDLEVLEKIAPSNEDVLLARHLASAVQVIRERPMPGPGPVPEPAPPAPPARPRPPAPPAPPARRAAPPTHDRTDKSAKPPQHGKRDKNKR